VPRAQHDEGLRLTPRAGGEVEGYLLCECGKDQLSLTQGEQLSPPLPTHQIAYFFADWTGSEDVTTLWTKHLNNIERIVANGIYASFVTG